MMAIVYKSCNAREECAPAGSGVTALHLAALKGSHAAVRELLRSGAAADAVTLSGVHNPQLSRGSTALHIAAARGHAGVVTALLDHQTGIPGVIAAHCRAPVTST